MHAVDCTLYTKTLCDMHMWKLTAVQSECDVIPTTHFHRLTISCLSVPLNHGGNDNRDSAYRLSVISHHIYSFHSMSCDRSIASFKRVLQRV